MTKMNLDKLPRRIDGDGMRWFSESDIQEAYTAGLQRALEIIKNIRSFKDFDGKYFDGWRGSKDTAIFDIEEEIKSAIEKEIK